MPAQPATAMTADEAFDDGNRLFRDDLYWAALLRYRQASDAGLDTPLLHYNIGIAHYRANQHIRARVSLLKAAQAPGLTVLAHYNLGLNAYAAGDIDDALAWFRRARNQQQHPNIRQFAIVAISRLLRERRASDPIVARIEKRREEKTFTAFDVSGRVGFGSSDNVYRAPARSYVDFADPLLPVVTPEVTSGIFMPVDLRLKYSINSFEFESFYGAYRMTGRYFHDKDLDNANDFSHELSIGSEYRRKEKGRERRLSSAFTFAQHDETYFDPDDGTARTINGEIVDDRLDYLRYGPQISFQQSLGAFSFGLRLKGQLWNYENTEPVPEYDHEYFVFGANAQYKFTSASLLRITVDKYSRRYGDRPSFDLNGLQLITNPTVRYDYLETGATARQRITDSIWFGVNYVRIDRTDRYLGYNDYTRDEFGFDFQLRVGRRFNLQLGSYYRIYSYPNAFAFHNPVAGLKTLETLRANLLASYRMTPTLSLVTKVQLRESVSTDARIAYEQLLFSIGVTWQP